MPRSNRKRFRRRGRKQTFRRMNTIRVPFSYDFNITGAGSKNITVGDLKLDTTRPLRIKSILFRLFSGTAFTFVATLVADGQESVTSTPRIVCPIPISLRLSAPRIMDYGLYGNGGSLCIMSFGAPDVTSSRVNIVGVAIIEYQDSQMVNPISGSSKDPPPHDHFNEHGVRRRYSQLPIYPPGTYDWPIE
jgi:hypothetical protein